MFSVVAATSTSTCISPSRVRLYDTTTCEMQVGSVCLSSVTFAPRVSTSCLPAVNVHAYSAHQADHWCDTHNHHLQLPLQV